MDDEFDITNVEGFRNSELEITHAAVIASWENAELSETYHDDILEERRVAEGVFSEVSELASTAGASDHSFEVVCNLFRWLMRRQKLPKSFLDMTELHKSVPQ